MPEDPAIRNLLHRARSGDSDAHESLFTALEKELREVARSQMARQPKGHTLQPTALVNEAYLRIFSSESAEISGRTHFMRLASRVMRQVLVDHARKRSASKRRSQGQRLDLDQLVEEFDRRSGGLVALDEALDSLQQRDPDLVRLVEMRFFGGRTMAEIGEALGVSERHALRLWNAARAFLRAKIESEGL
ncbi:MAG: ECF-type sigma factor [Planctomycetota bacterium]